MINSEEYWINRYASGRDSGDGSKGRLLTFKAAIINNFIKDNDVKTVIDYGCGDGNQISLLKISGYTGFDVSPMVVERCTERFPYDTFKLMKDYKNERAELTLSLDVIYHLLEDDIYYQYMERLFDSSDKYVIIYSSNYEKEIVNHEKRRKFTDWVDLHRQNWALIDSIPNDHYGDGKGLSLSEFFIYQEKGEK